MTKQIFAAIPARAMGDERLTALSYRVLMAIAIHDRLGKNNTGCFASHKALCEKVGAHYNSLSRAIRQLVDCGYVEVTTAFFNKNTRVYRVIYTDEDRQFQKGVRSKPDAQGVNQTVNPASQGVNRDFDETQQNQEDAEHNILSEAYNRSCETIEIYPVETAPIQEQKSLVPSKAVFAENPGGILAQLERALKNGEPINDGDWYEYLSNLMSEIDDINDPVYGRANRLREEVAPF